MLNNQDKQKRYQGRFKGSFGHLGGNMDPRYAEEYNNQNMEVLGSKSV